MRVGVRSGCHGVCVWRETRVRLYRVRRCVDVDGMSCMDVVSMSFHSCEWQEEAVMCVYDG